MTYGNGILALDMCGVYSDTIQDAIEETVSSNEIHIKPFLWLLIVSRAISRQNQSGAWYAEAVLKCDKIKRSWV